MTRLGSSLPARAPRSMSRRDAEGLVDQDEAERFHRLEVPVERGGHDAGLAGDLAQAQRAEAAFLEEAQRRGDDRAAGRLLALLARRACPANADRA